MLPTPSLLHLTDDAITQLAIDVTSVRDAIHKAFAAYCAGRLHTEPKTSISIAPGHAFQSLSAVDTQSGFAALKWVGMVPPGTAAVTINASILLSDVQSGELRCLMDGRLATALRTAGMTAVAAQYLARKDSQSIGFVGAGVQAESHLTALRALLPALNTVRVHTRSAASGDLFAQKCRDMGLNASRVSAQEAVSQSDIVITTVPLGQNFAPFNEPSWIREGAFVAAIDLGRSWKHAGLDALDLTVVDEAAMKSYGKPGNFVPQLAHAQATLADLAGGRHPGRTDPKQRVMLFSSGSAVADLAIAQLIYERALTGRSI